MAKRVRVSVDSILDDLDDSRNESIAGISTLPETNYLHTGNVCSMKEERRTKEYTYLDLLINGAMFR